VELPCAPGDDRWSLSDTELLKLVQGNLERLGLIQNDEFVDFFVHRMSHAYPVLELGFESRVAALHQYLGQFSNLKVVGRNGKFLYTHLHDMLRFGMDLIREFQS
jgi:protoporphyrinogen oxidase